MSLAPAVAFVAVALTASPLLRAKVDRARGSVVYIANPTTQDIAVFRLREDGTLVRQQVVHVPGPATPGESLPLAASPDGRYLFAALRSPPYSVATFAIGPGGSLTYRGSGPLADSMVHITTDHSGRFLLAASSRSDEVTVNPIGADGVVGRVQQVLSTLPDAYAIVPDGTNRHVLYTSHGGDAIHLAQRDPVTGVMWPSKPPLVRVGMAAGPRQLAFARDGRFVYVLGELDGELRVYPYDAGTGTLAPEVQRTSALPLSPTSQPRAAGLLVTPDGRYLYTVERTSSTLAAFRVDKDTGRLTRIGTYPTAARPCDIAIDPSSRFLIVAGELADGVAVHSIDPATGILHATTRTATGTLASWVDIVAVAP